MTSVDDIDSALRYIPADERDTWVRVTPTPTWLMYFNEWGISLLQKWMNSYQGDGKIRSPATRLGQTCI